MRLDNDTYEEIKPAVVNMLVDYNIKGVPLDPFKIADKMGIAIHTYSAMDLPTKKKAYAYSSDGFSVEGKNNEWDIYYNDKKENGRIRQTIMHEIGHYYLGHTEEGEEEEAEARFFAKYALAAPPLIHNMKKQITVENIMETFEVGYTAAKYAYAYYKKWMKYGEKDYLEYETKMLEQLGIDIS